MAQLKDVQLKITAVKKTKQITKAMNMVAASRLRGAQTDMEGFRPYAAKFAEVLGSLAEKAGDEASPLLVDREEVKSINIILCTSDRGLCGGFNANLISKAKNFAAEKAAEGAEVSFTNFGKKGRDWVRKSNYTIASEHLGIVGSKFGFNVASVSGGTLIEKFLDGTYDEVYVVYSEFVSVARQTPILKKILPIPPIEKEEAEEENKEYNRLRGWTENISVRKPWRRQGLARALLTRSMQMFKDMGMDHAALGVDTQNTNGALNLYESVGFVVEKRHTTYWKDL